MTENGTTVLDELCSSAVELAHAALVDEVPVAHVGPHLEAVAEADRVVTHLFESLDPAYVGWRWAVTVCRADGEDPVTVAEIVLLPGPESLLAPPWLPWQERVQAGDLRVGDVLPTVDHDLRLVPGYTGADLDDSQDDDLEPVLWELGLGRVRVLSPLGRDEAATRWYSGDNGPLSLMARAATEQCSTCGFLIPMSGPLSHAFGLCGNEYSPSDGHVVALDHGCGAHSEAEPEPPPVVVVDLVVDDLSADDLDLSPADEPLSDLDDVAETSADQDNSDEAGSEVTSETTEPDEAAEPEPALDPEAPADTEPEVDPEAPADTEPALDPEAPADTEPESPVVIPEGDPRIEP